MTDQAWILLSNEGTRLRAERGLGRSGQRVSSLAKASACDCLTGFSISVQMSAKAMEEMERMAEKGEVPEEELRMHMTDMTGKVCVETYSHS